EMQTEPQVAPQSEEETQAPKEVPAQVEKEAPVTNESTHAAHGACICAVKGSACSHEQLTWTAWESTTSLPTEAGNYYLTGKVTLAAATTISANVKICLNGFDVDLNQKKIVASGNVTVLNCQAALNGKNQLTSAAGKLYNGKNASSGTNVEKYGGAFGVTGTLNVYGVLFEGNTCAQTSDARTGGAIYVQNGTANIESCSFKANTSKGTGGAVMLYGGTMTIKDSLFTNNEAAIRGGAIGVNSKEGACTLTIGGNTEITGSKTTDTRSTAFYGAGGAVFAYKNGTANAMNITISGNTKITGNTASQEGGGIALRCSSAASPINFKLQDNVQIYGNAGEAAYDNLYFDNSAADSAQKVTLGNLSANANVKVNLKSAAADPDSVLALASGVTPSETTALGLCIEDKAVAYNAADL
ncbi:MAG: hypothetical protein Q4D17_08950, partial [Planctomycetia bacterium]|nr:hypothetical protein [Planctomycetia bacterium]